MARIGTTKLVTTVYIMNIGSGETSLNKTLIRTITKITKTGNQKLEREPLFNGSLISGQANVT